MSTEMLNVIIPQTFDIAYFVALLLVIIILVK